MSPTFSIDSTKNSPVDSKFRATFDNAAIGVALQTLDEQWIWFNQRWCEIVGFKREELIERNVPGLTHPEDRQRSADFEQRVRSGALERGSFQKRFIRRDGIVVWGNVTMSVVRGDDSPKGQCVIFLDDITTQKKAEQRLAAQFSVARILGEAPDASDAMRRVIEALCRELGWNAGSLWQIDEATDMLVCVESRRLSRSSDMFRERPPDAPMRRGQGIPGRVWESGVPEMIEDVTFDANSPRQALATSLGLHGAFAFPIKSGSTVLGVMEFFSPDIEPADDELLRTVSVIGGELGLYLERKLFEEMGAQSEVRQAAIVDAAFDSIISMDHRGFITHYNRAAEKTFGYTSEETIGKELAELIIPEDLRAAHRAGLERYVNATVVGETRMINHRVETWAQRKDGTRFPVELAITRIPQEGAPAFTGFIRDITSRKKAEQAIRESEERYRGLAAASVEGIIIHSNGIIVDANPALGRMFGYDLSELIGVNAVDLLAAPESREMLLSEMQKKSNGPYEVVGMRKDGSHIDVEITARSLSYSGATVRVGAIRDITDRKRAEQQERELIREQAARAEAEVAERRAAFLAEASRVLSMSFDYHTTIAQLARLAVPELADYCAVDVIEGEGFARIGFAHTDPNREEDLREKLKVFRPEDVSPQHPVMKALLKGESDIITHVTEDGLRSVILNDEQYNLIKSLNPKSTMTVPMMVAGKAVGALSFLSSREEHQYTMDELKLAEELGRRAALAVENARLYDEAQQATRARDDMLAIVAHDLRNPLNTIFMSAQFLSEIVPESERPTEAKQVSIVRRAAERMNRLIQDLLEVKRIESGRLTIEKRDTDATSVFGEALDLLRPIAAASSLTIESEVAPGTPRICIDPPRIQQVLSNLVGNAIKFTPAGGRITLSAVPGENEARFVVTDTGPGISADQLPHIFGRFYQGKRTDRRGIGLGLTIAKGIVEAHGGRIWVESQVGAGSSFYFTVPAPGQTDLLSTERISAR
ncbi:MAG TPA: PAS domain S-box protein [Gemmatimonadaceae bacterium]|nr:PAS domain S-box protein [Gemmatimonadaceae bacterium]